MLLQSDIKENEYTKELEYSCTYGQYIHVDVVTGRKCVLGSESCFIQRKDYKCKQINEYKLCGPEGKFWRSKETKEVTK